MKSPQFSGDPHRRVGELLPPNQAGSLEPWDGVSRAQPPGQGRETHRQHKQTGVKSRNESAGLDLVQASAAWAWEAARIRGLCLRCLTFLRNHILLWLCHHKAASNIQSGETHRCKCPPSFERQKAGLNHIGPWEFPFKVKGRSGNENICG